MRFGVCTLVAFLCAVVLGGSADSARTQGGAAWTLSPVTDGQKFLRVEVEGDTLYSATEVLSCSSSDRPDAGLVTFKHYGFNQRDELVCEVERTVLIRNRPATA